MSNTTLRERYLDTAITEAVRDDDMPDLAQVVARATPSERRRAATRCEQARQGTGFWGRRRMQLAALLLGSIAMVVGIWAVTRPPEDKATAGQHPHEDRVQDPKRVVPKDEKELSKMLEQVVSVQARGCGATSHINGLPPLYLDYDIGMKGFALVTGKERDTVIKRLKHHAGRKQQPRRNDFDPGVRLVLTLKNGRTLHVLIQFNRTLRVFADKDIDIRGDLELGNSLSMSCGLSSHPSMIALGYVVQSVAGFDIKTNKPLYPSDMPALRCFYCRDWFLRDSLDRFTKLRTLELSGSALTMTEDAFDVSQWRAKTRKVIGGLRTFAARGVKLTDENAADVLRLMPNLEALDLANCEQLAADTLQAIVALQKLRTVDLSGCDNIAPEQFTLLAGTKVDIVRLAKGKLTDGQRRELETLLGNRLIWTDE